MGDIESFTPALPGVTLTGIPQAATRQITKSLVLHVPTQSISSNPSITVGGDLTLKLQFDGALKIAGAHFSHFRMVPTVGVSGSLDLKGTAGTSAEVSVKVGTAVGTPIDVGPFALVPVFDFFVKAGGSLTASEEWRPEADVTVTAGVDYAPASGWQTISSVKQNSSGLVPQSPFVSANLDFTPLDARMTLLVWDLAGGSVEASLPKLSLQLTQQLTPPQEANLAVDAHFAASAGVAIGVWDLTLNHDFGEFLSRDFSLQQATYPYNGNLGVGVK